MPATTPRTMTGTPQPANDRYLRPFGGLSPREAQARSAVAKRANREQREREAAADTLTLSARAATVAARHLTQAELARYLERLAEIRDTGTPHQVIAATRAAESWLRLALAIPEGADASLGVDPASMTREQRAV